MRVEASPPSGGSYDLRAIAATCSPSKRIRQVLAWMQLSVLEARFNCFARKTSNAQPAVAACRP